MFFRSRNPLLIFLQSYHVWVTSKIQVHLRFNTYSEVLVIVSCRVLKFLHYKSLGGRVISESLYELVSFFKRNFNLPPIDIRYRKARFDVNDNTLLVI